MTTTTHPEYRALLADVIAHPADDGPRLVLADWLDDHGDETQRARGEFIRVQIELAQLPRTHARRPGLQQRESALLEKHREEWTAELPVLANVIYPYDFHRGFKDGAAFMHWRAFATHAEALFTAMPFQSARFIQLTARTSRWLARSPLLTQLNRLEVDTPEMDEASTVALCSAAGVANLTSLRFPDSRNLVGPAVVEAIAASPYLRHLTHLGYSGENPGDRGVTALANSPNLAHVTELRLGHGFGLAGATALAASPYLGNLTELMLGSCALEAEGVRALASSTNVSNLDALSLTGSRMGSRGAEALAGSPQLRSLWVLYLDYNDIGPEGAAALAASPVLATVRQLGLANNPIGDTGARALAASPHLQHIERLFLHERDAGEAGHDTLRQRFGNRYWIQIP
jgi:uncharacterized protein (TIGR02996 family)